MNWIVTIQMALAIALLLAVAYIVYEARRASSQLDAYMDAKLSPRAKHRYRRSLAQQQPTVRQLLAQGGVRAPALSLSPLRSGRACRTIRSLPERAPLISRHEAQRRMQRVQDCR